MEEVLGIGDGWWHCNVGSWKPGVFVLGNEKWPACELNTDSLVACIEDCPAYSIAYADGTMGEGIERVSAVMGRILRCADRCENRRSDRVRADDNVGR